MAIDLNTAEGRAEAVKLLDPDFQGVVEQKKVSERVQATMAVANVRSISLFSVLGEATTDIRTFAADQCGLDRNRDMVEVASLVDAWNACKTRMTVRHQAQAEAHNAQLPPPMNKTEAQDLRARFEQMFYKLEDKVSPATGTLELLSEQVDSGEFRAMSLVQFLSREDQEEEPLGVTLDKAGSIKVRKGFGESKPPKSGEELRQKVKLLGHCYIFTMLKYPNRQTLAENNPNLWNKYADYLLGEHVMRLAAKNSKGEVVSSPSLGLVLSYEYQVRKLMTRVMNEGKNIAEALEQAMKDTTVKERYFLTPAALETAADQNTGGERKSRSPRRGSSWGNWQSSRQGGRGRGGKGGGKGKKGKGLHATTPDGKPICFAWNNRDQRCRFACGREHVCQYCFQKHPAHSCPTRDTAGAGKPDEKKE